MHLTLARRVQLISWKKSLSANNIMPIRLDIFLSIEFYPRKKCTRINKPNCTSIFFWMFANSDEPCNMERVLCVSEACSVFYSLLGDSYPDKRNCIWFTIFCAEPDKKWRITYQYDMQSNIMIQGEKFWCGKVQASQLKHLFSKCFNIIPHREKKLALRYQVYCIDHEYEWYWKTI